MTNEKETSKGTRVMSQIIIYIKMSNIYVFLYKSIYLQNLLTWKDDFLLESEKKPKWLKS